MNYFARFNRAVTPCNDLNQAVAKQETFLMMSLSYFSLPVAAATLRTGDLIRMVILLPILGLGLINDQALAGSIEIAPF